MLTFNLEFLITLLLINRVENFRNSYTLTKVLAWKFKIIEFVELISSLQKENLIRVDSLKGSNNYEITDDGRLYLERYFEGIKPTILEKYSEEKEFINSLFSDSVSD